MSRFNRMVHRADANQSTLVEALRAIGASVEILGGKGVPDLLVGYEDENYLLEVKPRNKKLNDDQVRWHAEWKGRVVVVRTTADAFRAIGFDAAINLELERKSS